MGSICFCVPYGKKGKHGKETKGSTEKHKSLMNFDSPKKHPHSGASSSSKSKSNDYDKTESKSRSTEISPDTPSKTGSRKIAKKRSFLERTGITGLERAGGVLDSLGHGMPNLSTGKRLISVMSSKGYKISILAFEVANTIAKLATLLWSLSEENLKILKKEVLYSKGLRTLVSSDIKELLTIAASDKREELSVLSKEVIRFGNLCKDPQWHNLDRYFSKLQPDHSQHKDAVDEAETRLEDLLTLVRHTSELYHEMRGLDIFEQDYRRKINEVKALNLSQKGEGLMILRNELKQQRKFVQSLKNKSLWSRNLEEIMGKLVDAVIHIRQAIVEAFEMNGLRGTVKTHSKGPERLVDAGLTLHYANLVQQLASIASRPSSLPPNVRDMVYNSLPETVKKALHSRLQTRPTIEKLSESRVKAELEKILQWLVPLAVNTTKTYQGFGWVGEWANSRIEHGKGKPMTNRSPTKLQTLHYADREKMDSCILEVIVWLNLLVSKRDDINNISPKPSQSPVRISFNIPISSTDLPPSPSHHNTINKTRDSKLTVEERLLLEKVTRQRSIPGISKSFESVVLKKTKTKVWALSKSMGSSPNQDSFENPSIIGSGVPNGSSFTKVRMLP